mmetsp:Transcript_3789/g.8346  ORF Transcript_3789/g.8346 Transcript_3789/m.8346 type:complete len:314 (+) Transcript_3789:138-1079(+)
MSLLIGSRSKAGISASTYARVFQNVHHNFSSFALNSNAGVDAQQLAKKDDGVQKRTFSIPTKSTTIGFSGAVSLATSSKPWQLTNFGQSFQVVRKLSAASTNEPDDDMFVDGKPTLKYATTMRKSYASLTNEQILHFAAFKIPEACRECVIRDVMMVDQIEYDEAMEVFKRIAATNREGMHLYAFPFQAGFTVAFVGGFVSIPLVFHEDTMSWFNTHFVTAELPPPEDLETWLEVGSASWGWMEPVLGQVSFFLLCMQFARAQLHNLGIRPYFNWQRERRADRLAAMYPRYDPEFLRMYSKCDHLSSPHKFLD